MSTADQTQTSASSGEYENEPVPKNALKGGNKFWGMYAGEHAAGTEFMIGPLFLLNGVSLQNIVLGLLVGNLLAVLSWRYLCAPIATRARLTLYNHLERIAGRGSRQNLQPRQWYPVLLPRRSYDHRLRNCGRHPL